MTVRQPPSFAAFVAGATHSCDPYVCGFTDGLGYHDDGEEHLMGDEQSGKSSTTPGPSWPAACSDASLLRCRLPGLGNKRAASTKAEVIKKARKMSKLQSEAPEPPTGKNMLSFLQKGPSAAAGPRTEGRSGRDFPATHPLELRLICLP